MIFLDNPKVIFKINHLLPNITESEFELLTISVIKLIVKHNSYLTGSTYYCTYLF